MHQNCRASLQRGFKYISNLTTSEEFSPINQSIEFALK
jgi:hypothetical protein